MLQGVGDAASPSSGHRKGFVGHLWGSVKNRRCPFTPIAAMLAGEDQAVGSRKKLQVRPKPCPV